MLCQNCGKNEANVRYTEVINGEKTEMILCEKCSKLLGIDRSDFSMPIDFSSFFGGIFEDYNNQELPVMFPKSQILKCEFCNMTYDEFMKNGKFGCSNCYDVFADRIASMLKTIHGDNQYLGRKDRENKEKRNLSTKKKETINIKSSEEENDDKVEKLQEELKQAIRAERYEDAAKIRDEIKKRGE